MDANLPQVDVAGVAVGALDRAGWVRHLSRCVQEGGLHHHVSLNAAKWVAMDQHDGLRRAVRRATSVAADGFGIVAASRFLGRPLPERVPGIDLAEDLLHAAVNRRWRVALYGARPPVLRHVAAQWSNRGAAIVFARSGHHPVHDTRVIVEEIRQCQPDVLLAALGTPKAECFLDDHREHLRVPLAMGVGGAFDVWAGAVRRAPAWLGEAGLEWAWRFALEPRVRFERAVLSSARFAAAIASGRQVRP